MANEQDRLREEERQKKTQQGGQEHQRQRGND